MFPLGVEFISSLLRFLIKIFEISKNMLKKSDGTDLGSIEFFKEYLILSSNKIVKISFLV